MEKHFPLGKGLLKRYQLWNTNTGWISKGQWQWIQGSCLGELMWLVKFLRWGDTRWLRDVGALGTSHVCTGFAFFFCHFLLVRSGGVGWCFIFVVFFLFFFLKGCHYLYALKISYFIIYSLLRIEFSLWLLHPSQSAKLVLLSSLESLVGKWSTWNVSSHLTSLWKLIQK